MVNKLKGYSNDILFLGIFILIMGLTLLIYSFASFNEKKELASKINFEELEDVRLSVKVKYEKHLEYTKYLFQKLDKNKSLPVKNTSCSYLDYAQNNAVMWYSLMSKSSKLEQYEKTTVMNSIEELSKKLDKYKTCQKYLTYKQELNNLIEEDKKSIDKELQKKVNMDNFINGNGENYEDSYNYPPPPDESSE